METIRAHFNHGANYQALLLNLFFWLAVDDDATTTEAIVPSLSPPAASNAPTCTTLVQPEGDVKQRVVRRSVLGDQIEEDFGRA